MHHLKNIEYQYKLLFYDTIQGIVLYKSRWNNDFSKLANYNLMHNSFLNLSKKAYIWFTVP